MSGEGIDEQLLARKIAQGRGGDVRGMLGLPPDLDVDAFFASREVGRVNLGLPYEACVALVILDVLGEDPESDPVVALVVSDEWWDNDDEGRRW